MGAAVNGHDRIVAAQNASDLLMEVVQRVAVLGEDDQLALPPGGVSHFGCVLQDLRELVPFAVLARRDDTTSLLFQTLQNFDFRFQLVDRLGSRRIIDQGLFEILLLFCVQVVIVLRDFFERFRQGATTANTELLFAQATFEAFFTAFERLVDRLGTGGQATLKGGERETDRPLSRTGQLVGLAHFGFDVICNSLVERGLRFGERVVDGVCLPFREERRVVELDEFFLDHPPHQIGNIDLVDAVAEFAIEPIRIQQRQKELKIFFFAVVWRGRHQQQMASLGTKPLCKAKTSGLFKLRSEVVCGEFMGFVEDHEIPAGVDELVLQFFIAGHLVQADNQLRVIFKRIPTGRDLFEFGRVDAELQSELLEHLVAPLFDQAAGSHDQNAARVSPHDEFANIESCHDRLASARIVRQHEAKRLPGEHRFVDGRDLVR